MSAQKKIILLQRAIASRWLCTATSRQFTFVKATGNRYLSSVSPVFRHDDEEDHHDADQERKRANSNGAQRVLKRQAIKIQSPPVIDIKNQVTASTIERKFQQETATTSSRKTEKEEETTSSAFVSPKQLTYTGNATIPITSHLHLVQPGEDTPHGIWPVFRIMDEDGSFRDGSHDGYHHESVNRPETYFSENISSSTINHPDLSQLRETLTELYPKYATEIGRSRLLQPVKFNYPDIQSNDTLARAHRQMVRVREMDTILQNAQRQGRISFYMTCRGEEAIHFGAASALELSDVILAQYREQGVLMWRGFSLQQFTDQCFSNEADLGKGRQMPVHYGSRALNYQTISSPLGTQIPQAAGAAYRLKLLGKKDAVSVCFFGEGCASTTDFHSGLNFAATLNCPVIFICRNNGYAISTSVKDQYHGDGVVSRAPGYGMAAIRVDGNDIFAVHAAVREARAYALERSAPVLIEAMSYRQGHHSTSDDSLRYRSVKEVEHFAHECDPLDRLQNFLKRHEYEGMTDDAFRSIADEEKMAVLNAMKIAERKPKPSLDKLFEDVYQEMPSSLKAQKQQLEEHIAKYPTQYKVGGH